MPQYRAAIRRVYQRTKSTNTTIVDVRRDDLEALLGLAIVQLNRFEDQNNTPAEIAEYIKLVRTRTEMM